MASSSRQRSSSSASRRRAQTRPTTVKGRPSQGRSPRMARSSAGQPTARRASQPTARRSTQSSPRRSSQSAAYSARSGVPQGGEPLRSVSVSQVRNASRYRRRGASRRATGVVVAVLSIVVVLAIAFAVLFNSSVFAIEEVTVSGANHLTSEELTESAAVPAGSTLLNVDAGGIASRLESNPWVHSVSVDRVFPHTLNLSVTERSISAVVEVTVDDSNTIERWALSSDGMWLMRIPDQNSEEGKALAAQIYTDADNALKITDIPNGQAPEAGTFCDNANVKNALAIIDGMTTELADQVKSVSAANSDSTTLTLDNGVEIAFGDATDIRDKERVCLALMEEHQGSISYINVRTVNKPVWRSL